MEESDPQISANSAQETSKRNHNSSWFQNSFTSTFTFHPNEPANQFGRVNHEWAGKNFSQIWNAACEYVDNMDEESTKAAPTASAASGFTNVQNGGGTQAGPQYSGQRETPEDEETLYTSLYHAGSRLPGYVSFTPKSEASYIQQQQSMIGHYQVLPYFYQTPVHGYAPHQQQLPTYDIITQQPGPDLFSTVNMPYGNPRPYNVGADRWNGRVICIYCRHKPVSKYHRMIDPNTGDVICPLLRRYVCSICGATGRNAHTEQYCTVRVQPQSQWMNN